MDGKNTGHSAPAAESQRAACSPASDSVQQLSRRDFGRLLGAQAALATAATLPAGNAAAAAGGGAASAGSAASARPAAGQATVLSRAAFIAMIVDHFDWVHSSQYVDLWKPAQQTFADVTLGVTPHARQIEIALDEGLVSNAEGFFHPDQPMTHGDAVDICTRAFGVAPAMHGAPSAAISARTAQAMLRGLVDSVVAPPQVMCKSGGTAPRRYVRISTPTAGATIRYTLTSDGNEPADPAGPTGLAYDFTADGVLQLVNPPNSTTDFRLYRMKAVAMKAGLATSVVREFTWNIVRPRSGEFQAKLVHPGSAGTPRVWKINNPAEVVQPNVYYLEGTARGLVFDAAEYSYQKANLKTFIDTLATRPYDIVVGHSHPDHAEQIFNFTSAGIRLYVSAQEKAALTAFKREDWSAAGAASIALQDGQQFDLGNVQVTSWVIPGHTNGVATIIVNQTGWVYGSDMWGCNRPWSADTTQYQSVKVDLFLSLVQQLISRYQKSSHTGRITAVTNSHQETSVGMECVRNFLQCFQQIIDEGNSVTRPSIRGGTRGGDRMSMVGDMWRDRNWMAIGPIGKYAAAVDYLTSPTTAYPCGATIDYNAADGFRKYSVLSNLEIDGGTLEGVEVHWSAPANGLVNSMPNRFDPWTYEYTVRVFAGQRRLTVRPTALSNRIRSMRVNGSAVKQSTATTVAVANGGSITIEVLSPDGSSTSRYTLRIVMA